MANLRPSLHFCGMIILVKTENQTSLHRNGMTAIPKISDLLDHSAQIWQLATLLNLSRNFAWLSWRRLSIMECYATHLSLWRTAIYCSTLWLPLPPSQPNFYLSLLLFCTRFSLACLFGWMDEAQPRDSNNSLACY